MKPNITISMAFWLIRLLLLALYLPYLCINLFAHIFRVPFETWEQLRRGYKVAKKEFLFYLPQKFRAIIREADKTGLYHNYEYLQKLKLSDLLGSWSVEQLADLACEAGRGNRGMPWQQIDNQLEDQIIDFLGKELLQTMELSGKTKSVGAILQKLNELDFFSQYPSPDNATMIGNIAYAQIHATSILVKMVACKILLLWRERAALLT